MAQIGASLCAFLGLSLLYLFMSINSEKIREVKKIAELVQKKLIQSGNILEFYDYSIGYVKDYTRFKSEGNGGRLAEGKSQNHIDNRVKVLNRAKRDMRRLINANVNQYGENVLPKFLTIHFKENILDLDMANYEFEKYIKRLNYKVFGSKKARLKYVVGVEFQDRGSIHYHIIFFNLPYTKFSILLEVWGNGGAWINAIDDVDNVGAYVTAYLGDADKEQGKGIEDSRLEGRKSYFSSRGLIKPTEITDKKKVEAVIAALPNDKIKYSTCFNNEYLGDISYVQYNLNDVKNKGDKKNEKQYKNK